MAYVDNLLRILDYAPDLVCASSLKPNLETVVFRQGVSGDLVSTSRCGY